MPAPVTDPLIGNRPEPEWASLGQALAAIAAGESNRLAFGCGGDELTFAGLYERSGRRAAALRSQGVVAGDRVAIAMTPGLALVEVFWATQLLGAVGCVLNPFLPEPTLSRRISLARPTAVVTDLSAADLPAGGGQVMAAELDPDALAYLQLTSGTTGEPRMSMVSHRALLTYFASLQSRWLPDDVRVGWAPPWHDLGLVGFLIEPVIRRVPCHIVMPLIRMLPQWLGTISDVGGTVSGAPDFAYRIAARMVDPGTVDLSSLRWLISGGEPVRWSTIERFETRFAIPGVILPGYGLGEAVLAVTTIRAGEERAVDDRGNVSCGRAIPGLELRAGRSAEVPEEICLRGPSLFDGYFDAPSREEGHEQPVRDGWLHTGDLGYLDAESRLYVLGRRTGMIKRAGAVVSPRELEEAALGVEGIRVAAAVGVASPSRPEDEIIVVAVEPRLEDADSRALASDVSMAISDALGFAPGRVIVLPRGAIPQTENGKIRHAVLAQALRDAV